MRAAHDTRRRPVRSRWNRPSSRWSRPNKLGLLIAILTASIAFAADNVVDDGVRVVSVTPARVGDLVVCRLATEGLPGAKLLQSMRSGLVSAIDLDLALLDGRDKVVGENRVSLQLAFDLWEEVFAVRDRDRENRFASYDDLLRFLSSLDRIPVAPVSLLDPKSRYRVQLGLRLHPLAPSQRDRVEEAIAGDRYRLGKTEYRQEATVSLGRLIRLFYKKDGDSDWVGEARSVWFTLEELPDAQD